MHIHPKEVTLLRSSMIQKVIMWEEYAPIILDQIYTTPFTLHPGELATFPYPNNALSPHFDFEEKIIFVTPEKTEYRLVVVPSGNYNS